MSYCSNCGQKLEENSNFCQSCGTPVIKDSVISNEVNPINSLNSENRNDVQYSVINPWELSQNNPIQNDQSVKEKKRFKPIYIVLIVIGAILTLVVLFALIGASSQSDNNYTGYINNYSDTSSYDDFKTSISSQDIVGNWKMTIPINQLFNTVLLIDNNATFNEMDISDFKCDETIARYYVFSDNGTYDEYINYYDLLDKTEKMYLSYFDVLKNDKNKFLKVMNITESDLEEKMKEWKCESYGEFIESYKDKCKTKFESMKKSAPKKTLTRFGTDYLYKIQGDKLFVYFNETGNGYIAYCMQNDELIPVSADPGDLKTSKEDLLKSLDVKLVKARDELPNTTDSFSKDLIGTWHTKTGADDHEIIIYSSEKAVLIDGPDRIEAKINIISPVSFSLIAEDEDLDDLSNLSFSYSNGIITRYEKGIPDGYTYEKK